MSTYFAKRQPAQDNVFIDAQFKDLAELTGLRAVPAKSRAIIAEGEIVNVVSNQYAFLSNENYFLKVEEALINADVDYTTSSRNIQNKRFSVDYILGESMEIGSGDKVMPMLSFYNSYDSSSRTTGTFALFRQVCSNGMHIATSEVNFSLKHRGLAAELVMPRVEVLINTFLATEYRQIQQKALMLADRKVTNIDKLVKDICENTKVFTFATANGDLTNASKEVMRRAIDEADLLNTDMSEWLVYNAVNEVIHETKHRNFEVANDKDFRVFDYLVNA